MKEDREPKIRFEFDSNTGILFKYYFGTITIEDIHSSWEYAIQNNLIPPERIGFILDYRNATLRLPHLEYKEISNFYRQHPEIFEGYKIAIVTENPQDIVIPVLVREMDAGYLSRPFSTVDAAILWILT